MNQKDKARRMVRDALKRGALVRALACEICGDASRPASDGRSTIHGHHYRGYDFPLDVQWLCIRCHFAEDRRPAGEANGRAKLTAKQVIEIRQRYRPPAIKGGGRWHGENPNGARALAREYGVSKASVERIIAGVNWIDEALR